MTGMYRNMKPGKLARSSRFVKNVVNDQPVVGERTGERAGVLCGSALAKIEHG
jgi:hypothetical protein